MVAKRRPANQRGYPQTAEIGRVPVPVAGVNAVSSFSAMRPDEALYLYNILPSEGGLRTRLGQVEWTNGVTGSVRTVIPFHGKAADFTDDKLFCTGSDGIYEVTTSGAAAATKVLTFSTTGATAGYGNFINWTAANGDQYIQYADSANGLFEYDAAGDTWAAVTSITGITETNIRGVFIHKLRIYYTLQDDPNVYYLPVSAKTGAAAALHLGSQYVQGGDCAGIFNFNQDAGDGPDDYFIAVSRGGDVLAYKGTDPSSAATFALVGRWQVGAIPSGVKFGVEYADDVLLLSANGLSSLNALFQGMDVTENLTSSFGQINRILRDRMKDEVQTANWEVTYFPAEGYIVIQSPQRSGNVDEEIHYCLHNTTKGWGFWRGVNSVSMGVWREKFYYGNSSGEIWYQSGSRDNVSIADATGESISFSMLTAYSDLGKPGLQKQISLVRPFFLGSSLVNYQAKISYNYAFEELSDSGDASSNAGFVWDTATWDNALWGGDSAFQTSFGGGGGIGVACAVAIRGEASSRLTLAEISLAGRSGGFL